MASMRRKMRSRSAGHSARGAGPCRSSRLQSVAAAARSAGYTNILVGMQPTLTHVPPNTPSSTTAIRQSSSSCVTTELPEPLPTITRSKCPISRTIRARRVIGGSPSGHRVGHQVTEEVVELRGVEAARGKPAADVGAIQLQECRALGVGEDVHDLRYVDDHEP